MRFGRWLKILLGLFGTVFGIYGLLAARRKERHAQVRGQARRPQQVRDGVGQPAEGLDAARGTPYQEIAAEVLRTLGLQGRCAVTDVSGQVEAHRWCLFLKLDGVHFGVWGEEDATDRAGRAMVRRKIRAELLRHVDP
jgi:hypothetical protein